MDPVNVAELKNRLSHYLRWVRQGNSLLIRDRDQVIARIDPAGGRVVGAASDSARLEALEERGVLRRGRGSILELGAKRPKVRANVVQALLEERDDGR